MHLQHVSAARDSRRRRCTTNANSWQSSVLGSIGATFRRMRSTRGSSIIFTQIVLAKAMCDVAKWQPANNCSDTYVTAVAFGPSRRELIQPLWVTSRETSDVT